MIKKPVKGSSASVSDHLARAAAALGDPSILDPASNERECPGEAAHIWEWFTELQAARTFGGFGAPNPITYGEIESWAFLTRRDVSALEVRLLKGLDSAWLEVSLSGLGADGKGGNRHG